VEEGETLSTIARKFRISPVALAEANQLSQDAPLEQGSRLVLPLSPGKESSLARVRERMPRRAIRYRIRSGDTVELIADRFDVTPYQVRRWNNLKSSNLVAGKSLRLFVAAGEGGSRSRARRRTKSSSRSASVARRTARSSKPSTPKKGTRTSNNSGESGLQGAR
jgi:membrane-bound lytic murein transglycosylase D